ncbi:hypothetical protein [Candidatus Solirubrobacter pratensis]|uniref:hypothetical protein n=1 Tax=Candidatus Solirubrobacter pratensis TaxID=1298857 RepID=UPI00040573F2|nr:hypothetical protein [Candidatus Solirubrobacter pratensis]
MHALHPPPRQLLRAAMLALLLAFAMALMSADLGALRVSLPGGGGGGTASGGTAAETSPPAGPASWVRDPMTPPTILLAR